MASFFSSIFYSALTTFVSSCMAGCCRVGPWVCVEIVDSNATLFEDSPTIREPPILSSSTTDEALFSNGLISFSELRLASGSLAIKISSVRELTFFPRSLSFQALAQLFRSLRFCLALALELQRARYRPLDSGFSLPLTAFVK